MTHYENDPVTANAPRPRARTADLVIREMSDEVLVYDLKSHKAHCLNQMAAVVWRCCDGSKTVAEIAPLVEGELNAPVNEDAVWLAVERLGKASLLERRVFAPEGSPRLSRRGAIRKLGLGVAVAMPVVISIVAPTAVSAASCISTGLTGSCVTPTSNNCCSGCCSAGTGNICLVTGLGLLAACQRPCQCTGAINLGCVLGVCTAL
jgi:hypothetical protein